MKLKFEYKLVAAYIIIGVLWILFSDMFVNSLVHDKNVITEIQIYKGWFYVFVTALVSFLFLKTHLKKLRNTEQELENHKFNLQYLVDEKTKKLDTAIKKISVVNYELSVKNEAINKNNIELNKTLRDLKATQQKLLQTDKMAALGILTAGVAHEINNPLNYILGGLTGLEKYFKDENIENKKTQLFLSSIKTGVDKASSIVSGLNQFSRTKNTYNEDCDIHSIIENSLTIINCQLKNRIHVLKKFINSAPVILGNVGQLHQVFINILVNASQAIADQGSITILTELKSGHFCITISDTGCGIHKDDIFKITEPFYTTKKPGEGTGLGLSITYRIIQDHKGTIDFKSKLNKGSIVKIMLPLKAS